MTGARKWLWLVGVLVGGAAGGMLAQAVTGRPAQAAGGAARTIRATTIVLVDAEGREIGELGVREGGYGLMFRDRQGRERITLGYGTASDYYALRFVDAGGQGRFGCGASGDGASCGMTMKEADGTERVGFGLARTGCGLYLRDDQGREVVGLRAGPSDGDLFLKDPAGGRDLWRATWDRFPRP